MNGIVRGKACVVAPVFDTPGGGIQINLAEPIAQLLRMGAIEEIPINKIPAYGRAA
jgi:hypothetical protein